MKEKVDEPAVAAAPCRRASNSIPNKPAYHSYTGVFESQNCSSSEVKYSPRWPLRQLLFLGHAPSAARAARFHRMSSRQPNQAPTTWSARTSMSRAVRQRSYSNSQTDYSSSEAAVTGTDWAGSRSGPSLRRAKSRRGCDDAEWDGRRQETDVHGKWQFE